MTPAASRHERSAAAEVSIDLAPLLYPQSIAVIGASEDPTRVGGRPLSYLLKFGFSGPIYPVNPKGGQVQGVPCLKSIDDLPTDVDLAIFCLSAERMADAIRACGHRGVKAGIIFSAGFSEAGVAGLELQEGLDEAAAESGMLLCGPNSLGVMSARVKMAATFASGPIDRDIPSDGDVALVVQSGAAASYMYEWAGQRGINLGLFVSVGNESYLDISDYVRYLSHDSKTRAIGLFVEGFRDGADFIAAATEARANGKVVAILKSGRSAQGAIAALSHTGSLVGSDAVHNGVYRQLGLVRVSNPHELLDIMEFTQQVDFTRVSDGGVAVLSASGGMGVLAVDILDAGGMRVADLVPSTVSRLQDRLPSYAGVQNPVDLTGQTINEPLLIPDATSIVLDDPGVQTVIIVLAFQHNGAAEVARELNRLQQSTDKLILTCWMFAPPGVREIFAQGKAAFFPDLFQCLGAFTKVVPTIEAGTSATWTPASATLLQLPPSTGSICSEPDSKSALKAVGVPVPRGGVARSELEARHLAGEIGFPVVVKGVVPGVAHKSREGLVFLSCQDADMVEGAYRALSLRYGQLGHPSENAEVLVEQQLVPAMELIVSASHDPTFGPVLMCGSGGTAVEDSQDLVFRALPLRDGEAARMLEESGIARKVHAAGGGAAVQRLQALVNAVASTFAQSSESLDTLELNPVAITSDGDVCALDAVLQVREDQERQD